MDTSPAKPVFGLVLLGGPLTGAMVRDMRLANELADRGYRVHVWWVMDRNKTAPLRPGIGQHWLLHGLRYRGGDGTLELALRETIGRCSTALFSDRRRHKFTQGHTATVEELMSALTVRVCRGVEQDRTLIARFARQMEATGVTHMLPMLGLLCPFVAAARKHCAHPVKLLVTFQGYELYARYAWRAGCLDQLFQRLRQVVEASDYPAIAVSDDYAQRVHADVGVPLDSLRAIPPGVPVTEPVDRAEARRRVAQWDRKLAGDLPLVTFLGRQNAEKGIDLLLYAAAMLRRAGRKFQLVICGPTLFGRKYRDACREIADNLRIRRMMHWSKHVPDELQRWLYAASRCVVYPSIHREPFGMVPVEAMAQGTPAVVPDFGGVAGAVQADGLVGGLRFKVWDSGDLARQIDTLLTDQALWKKLSASGPKIAAYYSVSNLADRVLAHLQLKQ